MQVSTAFFLLAASFAVGMVAYTFSADPVGSAREFLVMVEAH